MQRSETFLENVAGEQSMRCSLDANPARQWICSKRKLQARSTTSLPKTGRPPVKGQCPEGEAKW